VEFKTFVDVVVTLDVLEFVLLQIGHFVVIYIYILKMLGKIENIFDLNLCRSGAPSLQ
jgi:hypothetical protein